MIWKAQSSVDEATVLAVFESAHQRARSHRARLSKEDAEDVAQEVVVRFAEQAKFVHDPEAWANRVAGNLCIDRIRRRIRVIDGAELEVETVDQFLRRGVFTSREAGVAMQAYWAVEQMTPKERRLIDLVANDVPQSEIAGILGYASADSVKVTLSRLRRRLLRAAEEQGQPTDWESWPRPY